MIFNKYSKHVPLAAEEERYFHLVDSIMSMERASKILDSLKEASVSSDVHQAAYKMAIIEYAKPYTTSFGVAINRHRIEVPEFSPDEMYLHKVLMIFRDKVLAHSDLTTRIQIRSATP